jgi:hypothetical protein
MVIQEHGVSSMLWSDSQMKANTTVKYAAVKPRIHLASKRVEDREQL